MLAPVSVFRLKNFLSPRLTPDVAQIANTFILRRNIGELLELGAPKVAFFERNKVHSSPLLKHENGFYRVKKGDLLKPFRHESENLGHFCHNPR
jgi:hypothetical protein